MNDIVSSKNRVRHLPAEALKYMEDIGWKMLLLIREKLYIYIYMCVCVGCCRNTFLI